jgi:hypothetical protein
VGPHRQGAMDVLDGDTVMAGLCVEEAQRVQGTRVVWFSLEDPAIDRLGGLQPTGLVVLNRDRECFRNGCHGADYDTPTRGPLRTDAELTSQNRLSL